MNLDKDFKVWEGVLDNWPSETAETTFSNEELMDAVDQRVKISLESLEANKPDIRTTIYNQFPISIMVAMLSSNEKLRILDFGGGLGLTYLSIKAALQSKRNIDYVILEFPELASLGETLFKDDEHLNFVSQLPDKSFGADIVFCGSSFQYVNDWQRLIAKFDGYNPEYIVFGDLLAGDIESYITMQNNRGHKVPVRFYNFHEFRTCLESYGYHLIFKSFHEQLIFGKREPLPMDNFPEDKRIDYGLNLIFQKT